MHADFRPQDSSRATHRRSADRVIAKARAAMASSADAGPHMPIPFGGARVAAFRAGSRIRFEVIASDGSIDEFHSGEASRVIASMMADA